MLTETSYMQQLSHSLREQPTSDPQYAQHMNFYRDAFIFNMEEMLAETLPVSRQFFDEETWQQCVQIFLRSYLPTPYFSQLPAMFAFALQDQNLDVVLKELLHYEAMENALCFLDEPVFTSLTLSEDDFAAKSLVLSPCSLLLNYHYPVHKIEETKTLPALDPTYLFLFRSADHQLHIFRLDAAECALLSLLQASPQPLSTLSAQYSVAHLAQLKRRLNEFARYGGIGLV